MILISTLNTACYFLKIVMVFNMCDVEILILMCSCGVGSAKKDSPFCQKAVYII